MPKWRKLWVKTLESPDFDALPDDFCRLMWVLLPLALDREGICPDNAAWVRSKLFPLRMDVDIGMVEDVCSSLRGRGLLWAYSVEGRDYLWCRSFAAHQGDRGKEAASIYPLPTDPRASPELVESKSGVGQEQVESGSGTEAEAETEAETEQETDIEAEADQCGAAGARSYTAVQSLLQSLGVKEPALTNLAGSAWVTVPYVNEWWAYISSWPDADQDVKVKSLICRLQERRQVPPDWREQGE